MKINQLIKKLEKIKDQYGNIEVIIDEDENGYYNLEEVSYTHIESGGVVNLRSSNET